MAEIVFAAGHEVLRRRAAGPRRVISGPGILGPGPDTCELTLTGIFPCLNGPPPG